MKNFVITQILPHGARFAQMSTNFKLNVCIKNDVVSLVFIDEESNQELFTTFFFIDYEGYKSFDDFSGKGQELILGQLSELITEDICAFISGKYENEENPESPYHNLNGCFFIDAYMDNWLEYYNIITNDGEVLDEYTKYRGERRRRKMIWYVLIAFTAILLGMFTSVKAFGTGGKRKKIFQDIYFSVEDVDGIGVLYTKTGEYSAILKIENPVQKYSANIDNYYEFTNLLTALTQTLGEGYAIHKQDVFIRKQFHDETNDNHEFLTKATSATSQVATIPMLRPI